jgi:hypothetical protein
MAEPYSSAESLISDLILFTTLSHFLVNMCHLTKRRRDERAEADHSFPCSKEGGIQGRYRKIR